MNGVASVRLLYIFGFQQDVASSIDVLPGWLHIAVLLFFFLGLGLLIWTIWAYLSKIQERIRALERVGASLDAKMTDIETVLTRFLEQSRENTAVLATAIREKTGGAVGAAGDGRTSAPRLGNG